MKVAPGQHPDARNEENDRPTVVLSRPGRPSWLSLLLMQLLVAVTVVICWGLLFDTGNQRDNWQRVYDACDQSVVEVSALAVSEKAIQAGTGFVIDFEGRPFILTCRHVVSGTSTSLIRFADGQQGSAEVVDASELHDLAILQAKGVNLKNYGELTRGLSSDLKIGEEVMTIGHPISESHHLSVGFYTGKFTDRNGRTVLRLSMAVDPGNSGGPLLNRRGQVVGIISMKLEQSANIAFAIPIEKIQYLRPAK